MFERFTRDARAVVVSTQDLCLGLGTDEVHPVHLLLALTEESSGVRDLLAGHGLTTDAVADTLAAPQAASPTTPLGEDDAAALRSLGIDLDAIREAVDRQFGEGALDAEPTPVGGADDPRQRRWGSGGRVRFGRGSKKALELALREAVRSHSGEIGSDHLALGVLRTEDDAVRLVLSTLDVDSRALRADLEDRRRRSA